MEALDPEIASRKRLSEILAEITYKPRLIREKIIILRRANAIIILISFFALFTPSTKQDYPPTSFLSNLKSYISGLICPHLMAQSGPSNVIAADKLAFLLYDPESEKEYLMLSNGDKLTDLTGPLLAKGFAGIQDIYLDKSGNVVCAAFDTTDIRDNWEIVVIAPNGKVASLTNTSELDESSPSKSKDNKKLAYVAGGSIYVEDSGGKIKISPYKLRTYSGVKWTPEDRLLVTVEEGRESYIAEIDPDNSYSVYRLTYSENKVTIRNPVISPNGNNLIYVREKGGSSVIVLADRYGNNSMILTFGDHIFYSDSATIVFSREFNYRSHIFITNGSVIASEAIIPALVNDPRFFIRSISSYTPYIIAPSIPDDSSIEENSENKDMLSGKGHNTGRGGWLLINYPNPFNPATTIQYEFPSAYNVRLEVFNIRGQLIRTLVDEHKAPGRYSVEFEAGDLSSGVYIYRLIAGDYTQTRKMVLMK